MLQGRDVASGVMREKARCYKRTVPQKAAATLPDGDLRFSGVLQNRRRVKPRISRRMMLPIL